MDKYKKHLAEKGFSKNTIDSYLFAVRQLQERLEEDWSNQELLEHKDWLTATFVSSNLSRYHRSPGLVPAISKRRYRE